MKIVELKNKELGIVLEDKILFKNSSYSIPGIAENLEDLDIVKVYENTDIRSISELN